MRKKRAKRKRNGEQEKGEKTRFLAKMAKKKKMQPEKEAKKTALRFSETTTRKR